MRVFKQQLKSEFEQQTLKTENRNQINDKSQYFCVKPY